MDAKRSCIDFLKISSKYGFSNDITERIYLELGVSQGGVSSLYMFILAVEILLIKINLTKHFKITKDGVVNRTGKNLCC